MITFPKLPLLGISAPKNGNFAKRYWNFHETKSSLFFTINEEFAKGRCFRDTTRFVKKPSWENWKPYLGVVSRKVTIGAQHSALPCTCTALLIPQSTQSAGPVGFLIFCSISMFLLAILLAGRRPQCSAGAELQRMYIMYSMRPIHRNIKPSPAGPGRSRAGPVLYIFSLLD